MTLRSNVVRGFRFNTLGILRKGIRRANACLRQAASTVVEPLEGRALFAANPVGQWVADNYTANSAVWADTSGNPTPHDATAFYNQNQTLTTTANAFNGHQAVNFAGGDGGNASGFFTLVNDSTSLYGVTAMTLVAYVRTAVPNTMVGGQFYQMAGLIGNEQGGVVPDWGMGFAGGMATAGIGGDYTITSPVSLPFEGVIAQTWDTSGKLSLYVNGQLVANQDTGATNPLDYGSQFALGCDIAGINGDTHVFEGQVAEFRIYNTNESADIAAISAAMTSTYFTPDTVAPTAALSPENPVPYLGTSTVEFNVTYSDDRAVQGSTIGFGDLTVTAPSGFTIPASPASFYSDGQTVTATYRFASADGGFGTSDAGDYTISINGVDAANPDSGVRDVAGNPVAAAVVGVLHVAFADPSESSPPSAALASNQPLQVLGKPLITFDIDYTDDFGIGIESLGIDDVTATDPQGVSRLAIKLGEDIGDGFTRVHYGLSAPLGGVTPDDAGNYTVAINAFNATNGTGGVVDNSGNPVAAGVLGTFTAQIEPPPPAGADTTPPNPFLLNNQPLGVEGDPTYTFSIGYGDDTGVDVGTLGNDDLLVTTPYGVTRTATYIDSVVSPDGRYVRARYAISSRNTTGLSQADQGVYFLAMAPHNYDTGTGGVTDTSGNAFPTYTFTFLYLSVTGAPTPPVNPRNNDTLPPSAALETTQPAAVFGAPTYSFTIDYSDNTQVDQTTLVNGNVIVTRPNGTTLPATFTSAVSLNNGALIRATYTITDPDGSFTAADAGDYTVLVNPAVAPTKVQDVNGLIVPPSVIGSFALAFPAPPAFPNLSLGTVTYAAGRYAPGGTIGVKTAVFNSGTAATGAFKLRIGLSTEATLAGQDAITLSTIDFPKGLQPGQTIPVNLPSAALPDNAAGGAYYLRALIETETNTTALAATPRTVGADGSSSFLSTSADVVIVPPPPPVVTPPIGGVDTSFGTNGFVRVRTGLRTTNGVALQADGKRLAIGPADGTGGGDFAIARFNADGSLDTFFGGNGTGVGFTDIAGNSDEPVAIKVQTDGKILVAGTSTLPSSNGEESQFVVVRYNTDGTLDNTFGSNGIALTDFAQGGAASADIATDLVILSDGKLLVSGGSNAAGRGKDFAFARYTANGASDTTFGNGTGRVLTDFAGGDDSANALSIDPRTGQMIAAGSATVAVTGVTQIAVARYNADGSLDAGFGAGGVAMASVGGVDDEAFAVAVNSKGQVVAAGAAFTNGSSDFAVVRFTGKGALDKSFNGTGSVRTGFGKAAVANQISLSDDGSLLVAGAVTDSLASVDATRLSIGLAVYLSNGSLDTSFDGDGKTIVDLSSAGAPPAVGEVMLQPGQSITVGLSVAQQALAILARQKSICVALGKVLIVGTSGEDTVASQVTTSGADLTTTVTSNLSPAIVGGTKGSAVVNIADTGNRAAIGTATISLYLSLDGSIDTGDIHLATLSSRKLKLQPGGEKGFKSKFAVPANIADGSYFVLAKIETSDSISELTQGNNTAAARTRVRVAAPFAQLSSPSPIPPVGLSAGEKGVVLLAVTNAGNIPAKGTFDLSFVAAGAGTPAEDDPELGMMRKVKVSLKPGASRLMGLEITIPQDLPAGSYYLLGRLESALRSGTGATAEFLLAGVKPLIVG